MGNKNMKKKLRRLTEEGVLYKEDADNYAQRIDERIEKVRKEQRDEMRISKNTLGEWRLV